LVHALIRDAKVHVNKSQAEVSLEVDGQKIVGRNTIAKYLAGKANPKLLGVSDIDKAEVEQWLVYVNSISEVKDLSHAHKHLDAHLRTRTYLVSNHLTLADVIVFARLHPTMVRNSSHSLPHLVRWFDLVQHVAVVKNQLLKNFPFIEFDLDVPRVKEVQVVEPLKKKDKEGKGKKEEKVKTKKDEKEKEKEKKDSTDVEAASEEKTGKKEKGSGRESTKPSPAAETEQPDITRLDIRVGKILSAERHPNADALYLEQIDLGDPSGPRTVVSGLVNWIPLDQMQDRWCVCLANLKPAKMRGVESQAMVLCATAPEGDKVELLTPLITEGVQPGDRVYFEGYEKGQPEAVLNPKKKYWENTQPDFIISPGRLALWNGLPFRIKASTGKSVPIVVETIIGGYIK